RNPGSSDSTHCRTRVRRWDRQGAAYETPIYRWIAAFAILVSAVIFLPVVQVEAWGSKGHRIIGYVADELLSPRAHSSIRELMGSDDLAKVGNYMDQQKNELDR